MIHKVFYQIIHFFHQMDEEAFSDNELLLNLKRRRFNILFLWKCIKLSEKDTYCMNILILLLADKIWKKKLKNVESILRIYICFAHFDVDFAQLSLVNDAKVSSMLFISNYDIKAQNLAVSLQKPTNLVVSFGKEFVLCDFKNVISICHNENYIFV